MEDRTMMNRKERRLTPRAASVFPLRYRLLPVGGAGYFDARSACYA